MFSHCRRWFAVALLPFAILAQEPKSITLPKPRMEGGKPLMQALKERKSTRAFSNRQLDTTVLSSLLWAGCGVNRPDGRRTAPSAMNSREIDVYLLLASGAYLYEPEPHRLSRVGPLDSSAALDGALKLVYVENQSRIKYGHAKPDERTGFSSFAAGAIAQNVYLYCASEGLATVLRASVDKVAMAKLLRLRADQRVLYVQSVGYPAK